MYPEAAEYVMKEITERYVSGFRDRNKFCRHIWAFYECLHSPLCNARVKLTSWEAGKLT
jgi:hypothetical protein